jgi:hypothetical protein
MPWSAAKRIALVIRSSIFSELDERLEVGGHCAREAPHLRLQACRRNELHGIPVVLRDAWETRFDPVDAEHVEELRDLELLLRVEDDADRLLAVAERGVVEPNAPAHVVRVVQRPRPDLSGQQRTIPSGKADSF